MNADLEQQLNEMGLAYRAVVDRLLVAAVPDAVRSGEGAGLSRLGRVMRRATGYLVAAGVLALVGLGVVFQAKAVRDAETRADAVRVAAAPRIYTLAYAGDAAAVDEIVRTQRSDGSWANDFLTEQNAAVLRAAGAGAGKAGTVAYRRAVRYLRSRGLRPLSDAELRKRGDFAAARLLAQK